MKVFTITNAAIIGLASLFQSVLSDPSADPTTLQARDDDKWDPPFCNRVNYGVHFTYTMESAGFDDIDTFCGDMKKHLNNNASCASKTAYTCHQKEDADEGHVFIQFNTIVSCRGGNVERAYWLAGGNDIGGEVKCEEGNPPPKQ